MNRAITVAILFAAACSVGDPDSAPVPDVTGYDSSELRIGDHLGPDGVLYPGEYIENGEGRLTYQGDGNLVLLGRHGQFRFASNTAGTSPGFTVMQGDGNLVIYDGDGSAVWASGTDGHPGGDVQLQRGCRGRNGQFAYCADDGRNDTFLWVRWTSAAARAATGSQTMCVFGCTLAFFPN